MGEAKRRKAAGDYPQQTERQKRASASEAPMEAVTWEIVGELAKHPKSDDVLKLLGELREEHKDSLAGKSMVVLFEDEKRQPIIRATTVGLDVFFGLIGGMQDLDLVDRLEHASGPVRGVDAAFS